MATGYWIKSGWVTASQLYATGYELKDLPVQSDMTNGRVWQRPGNEADVLVPPKFLDTSTGQRFAYGGLTFTWKMLNLSPKMVKHLQDTYFTSVGTPSDFMYRGWSGKLTVQTYNRATGNWEIYHVWARLANFASEAELSAGGYSNLVISMTAVEPVLTPKLVTTATYPTLIFDQLSIEIPTYATNEGGATTSDDVIMTYSIPTNTMYNFVDTTTGLLEWSVDNRATWTDIEPLDYADITDVRVTFTTPNIAPDDTTETVTIFLDILNTGAFTSEINWFTNGQADTSENTDTYSTTIPVFSPELIPNLKLWLKSDTGIFSDNGTTPAINNDAVYLWQDESGQNNHINQTTLANRPIYKTNQLNGYGGIDFDGTNDFMNMVISSFPLTASSMVYMVVRPDDAGNSALAPQYLLTVKIGGVDDKTAWAHMDNKTGVKTKVGMYLGTEWDVFSYYNALTGNQSYGFENENGVGGNITAEFFSPNTYFTQSTGTIDSVNIGSSTSDASGFFDGMIYEILVYTGYSDVGYRTLLYLKDKYGVT